MISSSSANAVQPSSPADLWSLAADRPVPRDGRCILVAVASAAGACIDRNFEDAEAFLLYEKCGRDICFIGRQPCPLAGNDPLARTRLLADCDVVLCTSIGATCRQTLSSLSIGCSLAYAGAAVSDAVSAL